MFKRYMYVIREMQKNHRSRKLPKASYKRSRDSRDSHRYREEIAEIAIGIEKRKLRFSFNSKFSSKCTGREYVRAWMYDLKFWFIFSQTTIFYYVSLSSSSFRSFFYFKFHFLSLFYLFYSHCILSILNRTSYKTHERSILSWLLYL